MKKIRKDLGQFDKVEEKDVDTVSISEEIAEEFRDAEGGNNRPTVQNTENWNADQDRSEDLANLNDPLIQQPERETQTPPELPQEREDGFASKNDLSETSEDLAHLFDRERRGRNGRTAADL